MYILRRFVVDIQSVGEIQCTCNVHEMYTKRTWNVHCFTIFLSIHTQNVSFCACLEHQLWRVLHQFGAR